MNANRIQSESEAIIIVHLFRRENSIPHKEDNGVSYKQKSDQSDTTI